MAEFLPSDISGLLCWLRSGVGYYDAATGGSAAIQGNPVARWEDQSGNGYHARQTDSGLRPTLGFSSAGFADLHFDPFPNYLEIDRFNGQLTTGYEIFIAVRPLDLGNGIGGFWGRFDPSVGASLGATVTFDFGSNGGYYAGVLKDYNQIAEALPVESLLIPYGDTGYNLFSFYAHPGATEGEIDNALNGTYAEFGTASFLTNANWAAITNATTETFHIGISDDDWTSFFGQYLEGDFKIAEVVIYNSTLTSPQRTQINNYLMKKFAIPWATLNKIQGVGPNTLGGAALADYEEAGGAEDEFEYEATGNITLGGSANCRVNYSNQNATGSIQSTNVANLKVNYLTSGTSNLLLTNSAHCRATYSNQNGSGNLLLTDTANCELHFNNQNATGNLLSRSHSPAKIVGDDFQPDELSNLLIWLDSNREVYQDTSGTIVATNAGDSVNCWKDVGGNEFFIYVNQSTLQPYAVNHVKQGIQTNSATGFRNNTAFRYGESITIALVIKDLNTIPESKHNNLFQLSTANFVQRAGFIYNGFNMFPATNSGRTAFFDTQFNLVNPDLPNDTRIVIVSSNASTGSLWVNNEEISVHTANPFNGNGRDYITIINDWFNGNGLEGLYAEFLLFNSELDETQRNNVYNYLYDKWVEEDLGQVDLGGEAEYDFEIVEEEDEFSYEAEGSINLSGECHFTIAYANQNGNGTIQLTGTANCVVVYNNQNASGNILTRSHSPAKITGDDFQPDELSNLLIWLDSNRDTYQDLAGTITANATGDTVNCWRDVGGNEFKTAFGESNFQSYGIRHGKKGVGTQIDSGFRSTHPYQFGTTITVALVIKDLNETVDTSLNNLFQLSSFNYAQRASTFYNGLNNKSFFGSGRTVFFNTAYNLVNGDLPNDTRIVIASSNQTTGSLWINNQEISVFSANAFNGNGRNYYIDINDWNSTGNEGLLGLYGEILFFNSELDTTQRNNVYNYLYSKWVEEDLGQIDLGGETNFTIAYANQDGSGTITLSGEALAEYEEIEEEESDYSYAATGTITTKHQARCTSSHVEVWYIGPVDNVAGITPDYTTPNDWWDNAGTVDLLTPEKRVLVYFLPGTIDTNVLGDENFGFIAITDENYYYEFKAAEGYEFSGDFDADIPKLITSNTTPSNLISGVVAFVADYTKWYGITAQDSGSIGGARVNGGFVQTGSVNCIFDRCGVNNIYSENNLANTIEVFRVTHSIVRNCVVNNITCHVSASAGEATIIAYCSDIGTDQSMFFNNIASNLTATSSSSNGGSNAEIYIINSDTAPATYAYNNVAFRCVANSDNGSESITFYQSIGEGNYAAYDSSIGTPSGSNNILIVANDEFVEDGISEYDPHLQITSQLKDSGFYIPSLTNSLSIDATRFARGIGFTHDLDGDERGTAGWSYGADDINSAFISAGQIILTDSANCVAVYNNQNATGVCTISGLGNGRLLFNYQGEGAITLSGECGLRVGWKERGTGSVNLSGECGLTLAYANQRGSGTIQLSGSADCQITGFNDFGTGSINLTGNAGCVAAYANQEGTGSLTLGGAAVIVGLFSDYTCDAEGGITLAGECLLQRMDGRLITLSGSADCGISAVSIEATGVIECRGRAGQPGLVEQIAEGSITLSGECNLRLNPKHRGTGSINLLDEAIGIQTVWRDRASGTITLSETAGVYPVWRYLALEGAFDNGYKHRIKISKPSANYAAFGIPVYVEVDLPSNQVETGFDFRFEDPDGNNLPYQLEEYSNGTLKAWVRIPRLNEFPEINFYLYFGNSTINNNQSSSLESDYAAIYHLAEDGGDYIDYQNGFDGEGATTGSTPTLIDLAQEFDGGDYIQLPSDEIANNSDYTFSGWLKVNSLIVGKRVMFSRGRTNLGLEQFNNLSVGHDATGNFFATIRQLDNDDDIVETTATSNEALDIDTWYFVAATWTNAEKTLRLYVDAQLVATEISEFADLLDSNNSMNQIGRLNAGFNLLDSVVDEVRISSVARSQNWLALEYENFESNYFTYGEIENAPCLDGSVDCVVIRNNVDATGTINLSGSANARVSIATIAEGQITLSGLANFERPAEATGTLTISGTAETSVALSYVPTGKLTIAGNVPVAIPVWSTGKITIKGSAVARFTRTSRVNGTGSSTIKGSAGCRVNRAAYEGTGSLQTSGNATNRPQTPLATSGGLGLTGGAAARLNPRYRAIGQITLTGAADGRQTKSAKATGKATLSGNAIALPRIARNGSGSINLAGNAIVRKSNTHIATGNLSLGSSADWDVLVHYPFEDEILLTGEANYRANYRWISNGNLNLSGINTIAPLDYEATATGKLRFGKALKPEGMIIRLAGDLYLLNSFSGELEIFNPFSGNLEISNIFDQELTT